MTASLIQIALDVLFCTAAVLAAATIVTSWRANAPQFAKLRSELAAGDPVREVRVSIRTNRVAANVKARVPVSVRQPMRSVRLPELRAAA